MSYYKFGRETEPEIFTAEQMYKKAILYDDKDIGKLMIYSNETLRHYITKAITVYYLKRMGHKIVTEAKIAGIGQLDVYDTDTSVNYEIESEKSLANIHRKKKKYLQAGVDLVIIQIPKHTDDLGEMAYYVKQFLRPD